MTKSMKRIHKVTIKRMVDTDPDTSFLGEYANRPTSDYSIDRDHDADCPRFWANATVDEDYECSCRTGRDDRSYQYFNPSWENYKGEPDADIRKYVVQDYARMESLNNQQWCYLGIRADASIQLAAPIGVYANSGKPVYTTQEITSGGLWGIESDSGADYFAEVEQEQLHELRGQLHAIGFSNRAITAAFRSVEREDA
jgi:hypothetical protein